MNRIGLTAWLLTPVVLVAGLSLAVDRDAARRPAAASSGVRATALPALAGSSASAAAVASDRTAATTPAAAAVATASAAAGAAAGEAAQPASPAAPAEDPNMVHAEFLPQGFVLVVKDAAGLASPESPIYLAGSWNGWDPGDKKFVLSPRSDLRWQIVVPGNIKDAPMSFKFTRGSWDLEELTADLAVPANRLLPKIDKTKLKPGEPPVFEFEIPKWGDQRPNAASRADTNPYYALDVSGKAERLQVMGGGVAQPRDLIVWLPPGYEDPANKDRRYPVLYLQDGQNVFQKHPGIAAEWGTDETAAALIQARKVEPMIIVGIPHGRGFRMNEYMPVAIPETGEIGPRGEQYVDFLVGEVLPRVERAYRVKTGPEHTAIGGASLGAIISLHAAARHPDRFGKVLLESMPIVMADGLALKHFAKAERWPAQVYFGMGGQELGPDPASAQRNAAYVTATQAFRELAEQRLASAGAAPAKALKVVVAEQAQHNEAAWADRFGPALEFLFPPPKVW